MPGHRSRITALWRLHPGYFPFLALLIACHTFSGVAGICTYSAPMSAIAWLIAFIKEASAPTVPDSPAPLTPSGLSLVGTSFSPSRKSQKSCARGIA